MDGAWIAAVGGLVGIVIGAGLGHLQQRWQTRQQRAEQLNTVRRNIYGQFLVAVRQAEQVVSGNPGFLEWTITGEMETPGDAATRLPGLFEELNLVAGSSVRTAAAVVVVLLTDDVREAAEHQAAVARAGADVPAHLVQEANQKTSDASQAMAASLTRLRAAMKSELGVV